jgi:hypothetical protein
MRSRRAPRHRGGLDRRAAARSRQSCRCCRSATRCCFPTRSCRWPWPARARSASSTRPSPERQADRRLHPARRRRSKSPTRRICTHRHPTHIHKMFKLPDGSLRLIVQGLARIRSTRLSRSAALPAGGVAEARTLLNDDDRLEIDALQRNIKTNFQQVVSLSPLLSDDLQTLAVNIAEPGRLADFIASSLTTIGDRRSSRRCSRRSTSGRAWTCSTACSSRSSRCSSSARRSSRRCSRRSARTSASTSCASS